MSVIPHHQRLVPVSDPTGNVSFTPGTGSITFYELRVYAEGTVSPVLATKFLGKPNADAVTGLITVNAMRMLNALPPANYDIIVAAVGPGGTSESVHASAVVVPLQYP